MARIDNNQVEAIINLANAAAQLKQPPSVLVNAALPALKLSNEDIELIASLGKARTLQGLTPEEMTFLVEFEEKGGQKRVNLDFSNLNFGATGQRGVRILIENIVQSAIDQMPSEHSSSAGFPLQVGIKNNATGAIASHDEGNLSNMPVRDATTAVQAIVANMEKQASAKRKAAEQSVRGA